MISDRYIITNNNDNRNIQQYIQIQIFSNLKIKIIINYNKENIFLIYFLLCFSQYINSIMNFNYCH